jgi:hypothetical protein
MANGGGCFVHTTRYVYNNPKIFLDYSADHLCQWKILPAKSFLELPMVVVLVFRLCEGANNHGNISIIFSTLPLFFSQNIEIENTCRFLRFLDQIGSRFWWNTSFLFCLNKSLLLNIWFSTNHTIQFLLQVRNNVVGFRQALWSFCTRHCCLLFFIGFTVIDSIITEQLLRQISNRRRHGLF